jgi:hypothetical protein
MRSPSGSDTSLPAFWLKSAGHKPDEITSIKKITTMTKNVANNEDEQPGLSASFNFIACSLRLMKRTRLVNATVSQGNSTTPNSDGDIR